jgi:hypothetical protein
MNGPLYHFTCDHSYRHIGRYNALLIPQDIGGPHPLTGLPPLLWFTDEPHPDRERTGLSSVTITCDRMAHRYIIDDWAACQSWMGSYWRGQVPADALEVLEYREAGFEPSTGHWWVSDQIVPARWDHAWALVHAAKAKGDT